MILKNIVNLFNVNLVILLLAFIFLINKFLTLSEIRKKFALLLILII